MTKYSYRYCCHHLHKTIRQNNILAFACLIDASVFISSVNEQYQMMFFVSHINFNGLPMKKEDFNTCNIAIYVSFNVSLWSNSITINATSSDMGYFAYDSAIHLGVWGCVECGGVCGWVGWGVGVGVITAVTVIYAIPFIIENMV